jgi:hypothetical protein
MSPARLLQIAAPLLLLCGCAHTVEYDLEPTDRVMGRRINKVVEVKKFADKIPKRTADTIKLNGETWRTNPQRGYTAADLAYSVSGMYSKHLEQSGLFRNVIYKGNDEGLPTSPAEAQLMLTGTITEYSVRGRVNPGAEMKSTVGKFFGLTGRVASVIANLDEETVILVKITLKDVTLRETKTGRVLWKDSITVTKRYDADYEEAGARAVYDNADDCLKEAIAELIQRMNRRLEKKPAAVKRAKTGKKRR